MHAGVTQVSKSRPMRNRTTSASMATVAPWTVEQLMVLSRGAMKLRAMKLPLVTAENPTGTLPRGVQAAMLRNLMAAVNAQPGPNHYGETGRLDAILQNVSAVLADIGQPIVPGFKPAPNKSKSETAMLLGTVRIALAELATADAEQA